MTMRKKLLLQTLIGIILISVACSEKEQLITYFGKSIDGSIIGNWNTSYSSRDLNNGITVFYDTIIFKSDNQGVHTIYKFSDLYFAQTFQFYTKDDSLLIIYDQTKEEVLKIYSIRNDSLIFKGNKIYIKNLK
jgi:hypothetical protein